MRLEKAGKCEWIGYTKGGRCLQAHLMAATEQPEEKSIDLWMKRNKAGRIILVQSYSVLMHMRVAANFAAKRCTVQYT